MDPNICKQSLSLSMSSNHSDFAQNSKENIFSNNYHRTNVLVPSFSHHHSSDMLIAHTLRKTLYFRANSSLSHWLLNISPLLSSSLFTSELFPFPLVFVTYRVSSRLFWYASIKKSVEIIQLFSQLKVSNQFGSYSVYVVIFFHFSSLIFLKILQKQPQKRF